MARLCYHAVLVAAVGLSGCRPHPLSDSLLPEPRPIGSSIETYHAPAQSEVDDDNPFPVPQTPTGELTLRDALAAALLGNPELASYSYDIRAAEARVIQAGIASTPEIDFEAENFAGSDELEAFDGAEFTLALSQSFPLGGDINHRQQLAKLTGELTGWDYETARVALLAETTQRYVELLSAQQRVSLAKESHNLAQEIADSIRRRVEAGNAPAVEQSRAAVPLAEARIALGRARRNLNGTRTRLALAWGSNAPGFTTARGDLDHLKPVPAASDLATLISQNPAVARWTVEVASRQAEIELARAEAVPDLTGSLGYRWFNDSDKGALLAGVSIPLPITDRRQGDILAARFGVSSARSQAQAVRLRVEAALASSYSRLVNAYEESVALRDDAIPAATAANEDIRQAFDQGNLGYIDVLDAERILIDLRSRYLDAVTSYHIAVAETESLIGQSLFNDGSVKPGSQRTGTQPLNTGDKQQ